MVTPTRTCAAPPAAATAGWRPGDRPTTSRVGSPASKSCCREYGRDQEPFDIYATSIDSFSPDGIKRLEDLGVTHTSGGFGRFNPYGAEADPETLQEKIDNLRRYADDVIAKVRP